MEPIPETTEAVEEYGPFEVDLIQHLQDRASQVQEVVPDCVGISLASLEHGVSFTVVATDAEIAALDGVQYLDGGPCVESVKAERVLQFTGDELLDEGHWQLFASATAARSIRSTLTLPIVTGPQVIGSVNLYAATPRAFTGHHEEIAQIFGGWAPGAIANADLGFSTRTTAERAPQVLLEQTRLQVALGILVAAHDISLDAARERLRDAAQRAGVSVAAVVDRLVAGAAHEAPSLDD